MFKTIDGKPLNMALLPHIDSRQTSLRPRLLTEEDKLRLTAIAAGLDRLVPQIAQAMAQVDTQEDYLRLAKLLEPAESFLMEAGPALSRVRAGASEPDAPCERFMRELPRRLRMIRTAQAVLPPGAP